MVETRRKKAANKEGVTTRGAQLGEVPTEAKRLDTVKQTAGASKVSPVGDNLSADLDLKTEDTHHGGEY